MAETWWGRKTRAGGIDHTGISDDNMGEKKAYAGVPDWVCLPKVESLGELAGMKLRVLGLELGSKCPKCHHAPHWTLELEHGWHVCECETCLFTWFNDAWLKTVDESRKTKELEN